MIASATLATRVVETPIGTMRIEATDAGVTSCGFEISQDGEALPNPDDAGPSRTGASRNADSLADELARYFAGSLSEFLTPLALTGTAFERRVWDELLRIPRGQTRSYGEIARLVGEPASSRAVGRANGRNRIAIVIPCHRVIAGDGTLHGYGGGLERKRWLLEHEGAMGEGLFQRI